MTPEYKIALDQQLKDTDWSVLPDVIKLLTGDNQESFLAYRTLIRDEMLELTSHFTIETIPEPPTAVWM